MNTQTVTLDVTKRRQVMPEIRIGQGDKDGTTLVANIYDNGEPFTLTNYTVRFAMRLPFDMAYYSVVGTVSGNTATFQIDESYAASVAGVTEVAYVEVLSGSTVICSTNRIRVVCLESAYENVDPAHLWDNGVEQFLEDAQDTLDAAVDDADAATTRATQAAEAAEGVILDALPTMTANLKGGAKLGSGLEVESDTLSIDLTDEATGETITAADASYLASLVVDGKAVQDGTPTPSNPIDVQVVKSVNLWDEEWEIGGLTYAAGALYTATDRIRTKNFNKCTPGEIYYVQTPHSTFSMFYYDANQGFISYKDLTSNHLFTFPDNAHYFKFVVQAITTYSNDICVNVSDQAINGLYISHDAIGLKVAGTNLLQIADAPNKGTALSNPTDQKQMTGHGVWPCISYDGYVRQFSTALDVTDSKITTVISQSGYGVGIECAVKPSTSYALSFDIGTMGQSRVTQYNSSGVYLSHTTAIYASDYTFTTASTAAYVIVCFIPSAFNVEATCYDIQLEEGSTVTGYVPFCDSLTPIDMQGEVLAKLAYVKDALIIDSIGHKLKDKRIGVVDLGSLTWTRAGAYNEFRAAYTTNPTLPLPKIYTSSVVSNMICTNYEAKSSADTYQGRNNGISAAQYFISVGDDSGYADAAAFKTAMNGVMLYYELETPETVDLGYMTMPKVSDGAEISITAQVTPTITASWWARGAAAIAEALKAVRARINAIEAAIAELATA